MRFSLVFTALLCFTTWMNVHATHGPVSSCCPRWSNTLQKVSLERILDYTIQSEGVCSIPAIVFHTKLGKRICSDPNSIRTKNAILKLEEKKKALQETRQNEEGSTSDITPTMSTKPTQTPQRRRKYGRRRRKKSLNLRKWQKKHV